MKCDNCGEERSAANMARHRRSCLVKHKEKVLRNVVHTKMTEVFNEMAKCKEPLYHVMVLKNDAEKLKDIVIPFNEMDCLCTHSDKNHCHYIGCYSKRRRNISHEARKAGVTVRGYQAKLLANDQHVMAALGYIQTKELIKDDHYHNEHSDELHTFKNVYQRNLWYKKITKDNPHIKEIYLKYAAKMEATKERKRLLYENKRKNFDSTNNIDANENAIRARLLDEEIRIETSLETEDIAPFVPKRVLEQIKAYPNVYEEDEKDDYWSSSEEDNN